MFFLKVSGFKYSSVCISFCLCLSVSFSLSSLSALWWWQDMSNLSHFFSLPSWTLTGQFRVTLCSLSVSFPAYLSILLGFISQLFSTHITQLLSCDDRKTWSHVCSKPWAHRWETVDLCHLGTWSSIACHCLQAQASSLRPYNFSLLVRNSNSCTSDSLHPLHSVFHQWKGYFDYLYHSAFTHHWCASEVIV